MPTILRAFAFVGLFAAGCQSLPSLSTNSQETKFESDHLNQDRDAARTGANDKHASNDVASKEHRSFKGSDSSICAPSPMRCIEQSHLIAEAAGIDQHLSLARSEADQGHYDLAKAEYRRVLAAEPDHPAAHQGLGNIADMEQDFAAANEHYQAVLRRNPEHPDLLSDMGYSYLLQGRLRESEEALKHALRIQPQHLRALNNLGLLAATRGDYDAAFQAFRQADGDEAAHARLAQLFPQGRPAASPHDTRDSLATNAAEKLDRAGYQTDPLAKVTEPATVGSRASPRENSHIIQTAAAEIDVSNEPIRRSANGNQFVEPSSQPREITPGVELGTPATTATPGTMAAQGGAPTEIPRWPPPRKSIDVIPATFEGEHPQPAAASNSFSITDADSATRYRAAAMNGLNAGPGGPFPVLIDSTFATPSPDARAITQQQTPAFEPQVRSGILDLRGARRVSTSDPIAPQSSTGSATVSGESGSDPLTDYEAEIRRRSRSPYSNERSFRTGTGAATAPRTTAAGDPFYSRR